MSRLTVLLVLAGLALVAGCGGSGQLAGPAPGRSLVVDRTLTPPAHLFGDFVHVRADVIVDRRTLDPDRVRLSLNFLPYRIQTGVARSRTDFPRFTRLRWEATLRCITVACVPTRLQSVLGAQEGRGERRTYRFKPAHVYYDDPAKGTVRHLRRIWWPAVDAISRLSPTFRPPPPGVGPGAEFQSTLFPLARPTYGLPPWLLAGLLFAAALGLLAFPALLVARALARRREERVVAARTLTPLERALLRVEAARDGGDADARREALEALAFELDGDGRAARVRALAWRHEPPSARATTALVAELRGGGGGDA